MTGAEELESYLNAIQTYVMERTDMTEEEAYSFAFKCYQLDFHYLPDSSDRCVEIMLGDMSDRKYLYTNTCSLMEKLSRELLGSSYDILKESCMPTISKSIDENIKY